jgi:uncharacterized protein
MSVCQISIAGEEIILLPERAVIFKRKETMVISDLHLGKINHFRKAGIPVPVAANQANTETLIRLMMTHQPKRVIFIGDLFHSHYNTEWEVLGQVIKNFPGSSFELVPGNHDIMSAVQYQRNNLLVHEVEYSFTPEITLVHEPTQSPKESVYYLSGHIHPAITLTGKGRQSLTLPCFWFGKRQGFLPAFGVFTGFRPVRPEEGDKIFAITKDEVMEITSTPA